MATTMTLLQMRTAARQRADMENASGDYTSAFIKDPELTSYINQSIFELYDILISKFGEDYFLADPYTITTDGMNDTYALPSDFYKLAGVSILSQASGTNYLPLKRATFAEMTALSGIRSQSVMGITNLMYRLRANKIWLAPLPQAGQSIRIFYAPTFVPLSLDTDTFDGISGWTEYPIVDAAIKCMQKEESDVSVLMLQKQALLQRIESASSNRDTANPQTVADTEGNTSLYAGMGYGWWGR